MHLQWYPGHMTKAMRMMEDSVKLVDSIIYLLDARAVAASFNYNFDKLLSRKTILYIINKADLVDKVELNKWVKKLQGEGKKVIVTNSATGNCSRVVSELLAINKDVIARFKERGANKSIRAMVIGIPNSGKSTLVNALCGSKRAVTGDRPGVTRGKQWVSLGGGVELFDTPGTLMPAFDNQEIAAHLAFIGSINEDVIDVTELAIELIKFFKSNYTALFADRYKIVDMNCTELELLEQCGKARGFVVKGGAIDIERSAKAVVDDFRKNRIGKVMLEFAGN